QAAVAQFGKPALLGARATATTAGLCPGGHRRTGPRAVSRRTTTARDVATNRHAVTHRRRAAHRTVAGRRRAVTCGVVARRHTIGLTAPARLPPARGVWHPT